jgi:hypothetical protein
MASPDVKEGAFSPEHVWLEDADLLTAPARPLTPAVLFVCTFVAKLDNLHIGFVRLTEIMCASPHGPLIAVNSNFGHACQPGYEDMLKTPKPLPERRVPARGRPRKVQGDGTCFNSAVEPTFAIEHPGVSANKTYKTKCFSTTGEVQVPGVICPDLSDGYAVIKTLVDYLNELEVGDEGRKITVISQLGKMMNYKMCLIRSCPRLLFNLRAVATYMHILELTKAVEGAPLTDAQAARFAGWPTIILPPYPVRETKPPTDDVKVSFRFRGANRAPRINIFQEGKINILGADSSESAQNIYDFFVQLFTANWAMFVCLQPRRDLERRQAAPPVAPVPAPVQLTDAEIDVILADVFDSVAEPPVTEEFFGTAVRDIVAGLDEWDFNDGWQ